MKRDELKFWFCFLLLNFILFVPRYLFEFNTSSFFPYHIFSQGGIFYSFKYIFNRENYDIFRFSIDFSLLVFLIFLFRRKISLGVTGILLPAFYIIIFVYQAYAESFEAIYNVEPFLYTDISSLKTGFKIATDGKGFLIIIYILLFGLAVFGISKLIKYFIRLIQKTEPGITSRIFGSVLIILMLYSHIRYGGAQVSSMEFTDISYNLVSNIVRSLHTEKLIRKIDLSGLKNNYRVQKLELRTSPNVYFIFVESYGKIVYTNKQLKDSYLKQLAKSDSLLAEKNFYCASVLSKSPVFGGISWVSYSSVLYGINFMDSKTFDVLTGKKELNEAVSLVKLLKNSGYKNYRLASIKPQNNMVIPWDKYSRIYSVDKWIRFGDLNYNGKLYGFGPSPPDEYSLNFAYNYIKKDDKAGVPYTLFFITMNSHNPFLPPEISKNGWRDLNKNPENVVQKSVFLKRPDIKDYGKAINYEISFLTDFILRNGGNDIFLLIGDHQPPIIAKSNDGFETPVHVISRDSTFIHGFSKYGFTNGLRITDLDTSVRHEGIYTIFLREFMRNYAVNSDSLPEYLPKGINIMNQ